MTVVAAAAAADDVGSSVSSQQHLESVCVCDAVCVETDALAVKRLPRLWMIGPMLRGERERETHTWTIVSTHKSTIYLCSGSCLIGISLQNTSLISDRLACIIAATRWWGTRKSIMIARHHPILTNMQQHKITRSTAMCRNALFILQSNKTFHGLISLRNKLCWPECVSPPLGQVEVCFDERFPISYKL